MPRVIEIIHSAPNISDTPRVEAIIRRIEENIRNKPKPSSHILTRNKILERKIRQILDER